MIGALRSARLWAGGVARSLRRIADEMEARAHRELLAEVHQSSLAIAGNRGLDSDYARAAVVMAERHLKALGVEKWEP